MRIRLYIDQGIVKSICIYSTGYLYNVAREMKEINLLVEFWPDERRTVRRVYKMDNSEPFYEIVAASLTERIIQVRKYLHYILELV